MTGRQGFADSPQDVVQQVFEHIHRTEMAEMPFCQPGIEVVCAPFQQQEGSWLGAVLTPWMMSLLILPGADSDWPERQLGSKIGLALAGREYTFTVGEHEQLGQYLACSLMSPLNGIHSQEQGEQLLQDITRLAWAIPLHNGSDDAAQPVDLTRRRFLRTFDQREPVAPDVVSGAATRHSS